MNLKTRLAQFLPRRPRQLPVGPRTAAPGSPGLPAEARPKASAMSVLSRGGLRRLLPLNRAGASRGRGGGTCTASARACFARKSPLDVGRGGPGRSTRTTLSSRLSIPRSGSGSRTARSSTWRLSVWRTRSCASSATTTRRLRRSSTPMCWAWPHPACRMTAAWSSSSRQETRGCRGPGR